MRDDQCRLSEPLTQDESDAIWQALSLMIEPGVTFPRDDLGWLYRLLTENRYSGGRLLGDGRYTAIRPMLYTTRLIVGRVGDDQSADDGWCYTNADDAIAAMRAWDGVGEPRGWFRHPGTGRRVAQADGEVDEQGKRIAAGADYVRA